MIDSENGVHGKDAVSARSTISLSNDTTTRTSKQDEMSNFVKNIVEIPQKKRLSIYVDESTIHNHAFFWCMSDSPMKMK